MKTIDAIKGKEWEVLFNYGFKRTNNKHIDCVLCGKKKSFRLNEYQGRPAWICTCGSGDLFSLLIQATGMSFKFLANEIDKIIGNTQDRQAAPIRRDYEGELLALWKTLRPIKGTSVQRYLQSRGIYSIPPRAIKVSGNDQERKMIAVATNDAGVPRMTHTTYLQGDSKAQIETPKRWSRVDKDKDDSIQESIAIRMFDVQSCLGISEGIESALSAHVLYQCAVWSVLSTSVMKNFRAPPGVSHLIIFADVDNNGAGLAAAFVCGHANILAKNDVERVTIRYAQKGDMNDCLQCAQEINEFKLTK